MTHVRLPRAAQAAVDTFALARAAGRDDFVLAPSIALFPTAAYLSDNFQQVIDRSIDRAPRRSVPLLHTRTYMYTEIEMIATCTVLYTCTHR